MREQGTHLTWSRLADIHGFQMWRLAQSLWYERSYPKTARQTLLR